MPYRKSRAKRDFDSEADSMISVIRSTLKLLKESETPDPRIKDYILSSCMMLGSAKLEVYIENVIDGWIANVNGADLTVANIPDNMKALFFNQNFLKNAFKNLIIENNESEYISLIVQNLNNNIFSLTRPTERLPALESKRVYERKKYPSPDNIKAVFKRIGVANMLNELNKDARENIHILIDSYNDLRSAISHSGIPAGINERDVIEKLTNLKKITFHIDRVFLRHITQHNIKHTWPL